MSIYAYQQLKSLGFSEPRLLRTLPNIQARSLDPGHVICRNNFRPEAFSHVVSGMVSAVVTDKKGVRTPIHIIGPGTWFGVNAVLDPLAVSNQTICLTPVRLLDMPLADATEAFENEPKFSQYLAQLMSWRNQRHIERLTLMRLGSPQLRVVMGLALFAEAMHSSNSHLPTNDLDDFQDIPFKQAKLASLCGVSRGMFSQCAQQLAAAGWIRLNYATLALLRFKAWHRFCNDYRNNHRGNSTDMASMQEILNQMSEASVY